MDHSVELGLALRSSNVVFDAVAVAAADSVEGRGTPSANVRLKRMRALHGRWMYKDFSPEHSICVLPGFIGQVLTMKGSFSFAAESLPHPASAASTSCFSLTIGLATAASPIAPTARAPTTFNAPVGWIAAFLVCEEGVARALEEAAEELARAEDAADDDDVALTDADAPVVGDAEAGRVLLEATCLTSIFSRLSVFALIA
ncbi:hypothetical protein MMC07_008624 [Pseudocyphellaria aurata]|nr:hypothetical protein [Pseudocyphellaria aurata]